MKRTRRKSLNKSHRAKAQRRRAGGRNERHAIRLQTIGDIAAVLGHESRNLFAALKTCLQVLRRNPQLAAEDRELLDIIEIGAGRLGDVMADFAVFSRTAPPRWQTFSIADLIDELWASLPQRRWTGITMKKNFDNAPVEIQADREQLRQALRHLILNGAQAAGDGGTLTVETAITKTGSRLVVRDDGPGIARADLGRIFEPLYTTKPRSAGLGLAVARCIIESHGGRLSVRSQAGQGAAFIIELPAAPKPSGAARRKRKRGA